jgi:hypothetical protein
MGILAGLGLPPGGGRLRSGLGTTARAAPESLRQALDNINRDSSARQNDSTRVKGIAGGQDIY